MKKLSFTLRNLLFTCVILLLMSNLSFSQPSAELKSYVPTITTEDIDHYVKDEGDIEPVLKEVARARIFNKSVEHLKNQIFSKISWDSDTTKGVFTKIIDIIPDQYKMPFMRVMYDSLSKQLSESQIKTVSEDKIYQAVEYLLDFYKTPQAYRDRHKADIEKALEKKIFPLSQASTKQIK